MKPRASESVDPSPEIAAMDPNSRSTQSGQDGWTEEKEENEGREIRSMDRETLERDRLVEKKGGVKAEIKISPTGINGSKKGRRSAIPARVSDVQSSPSQAPRGSTPSPNPNVNSDIALVTDAIHSYLSGTNELMKGFQAQGARTPTKLAKSQKAILSSKNIGPIDGMPIKALSEQRPVKPLQLKTVQIQLNGRRIANMTKEVQKEKEAQGQRDASAKVSDERSV